MHCTLTTIFAGCVSIYWHCLLQTLGHLALASFLWVRAHSVDIASKASVTSFYMFIWKVGNVSISIALKKSPLRSSLEVVISIFAIFIVHLQGWFYQLNTDLWCCFCSCSMPSTSSFLLYGEKNCRVLHMPKRELMQQMMLLCICKKMSFLRSLVMLWPENRSQVDI
jgi:hypothetical protein